MTDINKLWYQAFQEVESECKDSRRRISMSYDIAIVDEEDTVLRGSKVHKIAGGTYEMGGSYQAWLNITYNYSQFYYQIWPEGLIDKFNGMNSKDAIAYLLGAIKILGTKTTQDYWEATPGNAGKALQDLVKLIQLFPEGKLRIT